MKGWRVVRADCMRFQATWQSLAVLADPGLRIKHRRRGLALAVAWALGGTLAVALNPAAVAQPFPATLPLSSLDGSNGFKLDGEAAGNDSGVSVSAAGDINGDGNDDLIVGASGASPSGLLSGRSYVVFGANGGFAPVLPLSQLNRTTGLKLDGEMVGDYSGLSVSAAGDVNGDGVGDLIIGACYGDPNGYQSGRSYVVFGASEGFAATLLLSSLDGGNGFKLDGEGARDLSGYSVSAAGDINDDGIDDLIVGAFGAGANGGASGRSYVVFGSRDGFAATLPLSSLNGNNGFALDGESPYDYSGVAVSAAGDVNGDGVDDLIIGALKADSNAPNSGRSYVVFGSGDGFAASFPLSTLDGSNGFILDGEGESHYLGVSVSAAGDVNGDGIDDLIIGASGADPNGFASGRSYVVFGSDKGFAGSLALSSLDGSNGFELDGEVEGDRSGRSVSSAGDINGDGIDDLMIGAPMANHAGINSGRAYVVFGSRQGFGATVALSSLNGANGFKLDGESAGDLLGRSVSAAGDVNGDGIDDVIVGAFGADPNGHFSGRSYVVFGRDSTFADGFE